MLRFILRRIGISFLVLLSASFLLYIMVINSGDPLEDLRESNNENRDQLIAARTAFMGLDDPWYLRYWNWLRGVAGCVTLNCDLGVDRTNRDVGSLLGQAASSTLRLVVIATVLAIIVGVALGILTAIRQYSGFDYTVTFGAFLFFSLPVFWAAVLLKEYGAIRYNDWIADGWVSPPAVLLIAALLAFLAQAVLGGDARRRLLTAGATFVFAAVVMFVFNALDWYRNPFMGPVVVTLVAPVPPCSSRRSSRASPTGGCSTRRSRPSSSASSRTSRSRGSSSSRAAGGCSSGSSCSRSRSPCSSATCGAGTPAGRRCSPRPSRA
ncbi:hypothetical protein [Cellulosimicrobium sp. CUA-896]|uniref:hypothetical protein n=1 Tax=Cellulosimicrobium sp. CUA-896 TaxID=1517881 RepID=UPI000AAC80EE